MLWIFKFAVYLLIDLIESALFCIFLDLFAGKSLYLSIVILQGMRSVEFAQICSASLNLSL